MLCYIHAECVPLQALSDRRTGTADDKDHRLLPLCLEPPSGILQQVLYKKERKPYSLRPQQFYSSYPKKHGIRERGKSPWILHGSLQACLNGTVTSSFPESRTSGVHLENIMQIRSKEKIFFNICIVNTYLLQYYPINSTKYFDLPEENYGTSASKAVPFTDNTTSDEYGINAASPFSRTITCPSSSSSALPSVTMTIPVSWEIP